MTPYINTPMTLCNHLNLKRPCESVKSGPGHKINKESPLCLHLFPVTPLRKKFPFRSSSTESKLLAFSAMRFHHNLASLSSSDSYPLHQMEWQSFNDAPGALMDNASDSSDSPRLNPSTATNLSENEFSCHCCYDILVNPTTLTCGHNFCRHCLALWWESSHKNECPECREKWEGFPKINILLRYDFHCQNIHVFLVFRRELRSASLWGKSMLVAQAD